MKLSRGSFVIVLIALAVLLIGVIQLIVREFGDHPASASSTMLPCVERAVTCTIEAS